MTADSDLLVGRTTSVLLLAATAVSVGLIVLSFVLPVYTVPNGELGPQPQETLVEHLGWHGALPAVGLLVATVIVATLLRWGRSPVTRGELVVVRVLALLVLAATLVSVVAFHLVRLLSVPAGVLLLVAAANARSKAPASSVSPATGVA